MESLNKWYIFSTTSLPEKEIPGQKTFHKIVGCTRLFVPDPLKKTLAKSNKKQNVSYKVY